MTTIILWIIVGLIGATLMAYGVKEPTKRFIPFGIVLAPVALAMGIIWALVRLGEDL